MNTRTSPPPAHGEGRGKRHTPPPPPATRPPTQLCPLWRGAGQKGTVTTCSPSWLPRSAQWGGSPQGPATPTSPMPHRPLGHFRLLLSLSGSSSSAQIPLACAPCPPEGRCPAGGARHSPSWRSSTRRPGPWAGGERSLAEQGCWPTHSRGRSGRRACRRGWSKERTSRHRGGGEAGPPLPGLRGLPR